MRGTRVLSNALFNIKKSNSFFNIKKSIGLETRMKVNLSKSLGTTLVDSNGKRYIDMYNNIASLPVGYNHPRMLDAVRNGDWNQHLLQRQSLGVMPPDDWEEQIDNSIGRINPNAEIYDVKLIGGCGSVAVENALKTAFLYKARNENCKTDYTLSNISPQYSILSFKGGFHGRTLGALSATRSKSQHKWGIPAFSWPMSQYPNNKNEENDTLTNVDYKLANDKNIAGIIIEPIAAEGGDIHASPEFFRSLNSLANRYNVPLIVDEVQTSLATGKPWAHTSWGCEPDIIVFSKKTQVSGYFVKENYRTNEYEIFNTYCGDALRVLQLGTILDIIDEGDLFTSSAKIGDSLVDGIKLLSRVFPHLIKNVRGEGLLIAFDTPIPALLLQNMTEKGILASTCGINSIRLRPSLIFNACDCGEFLDKLENAVITTNSMFNCYD
jgi:4-aminobutyrate aminotransferase/(S)-3-amino-2-methylpropionate transaminase